MNIIKLVNNKDICLFEIGKGFWKKEGSLWRKPEKYVY